MIPKIPQPLLIGIAALFGSLVGSFLNVCIFRLPRNLSVHTPARSFCPQCQKNIPWWENIPVFSWLFLRGKCSSCQKPIPARYLFVELLTAILFAAAAAKFGSPTPTILIPYFALLGILVVATFIDLEHMIIPDEITWGGVGAGALLSLVFPALHAESTSLLGLSKALLGAFVGYITLWAVVEFGRLAFGRKKITFDPPVDAIWIRNGEEAQLTVDSETTPWGDYFFRGSERIRMEVLSGDIDGLSISSSQVVWSLNDLHFGASKRDLNQIDRINFQIKSVVFPREAMGFGDVKFLAAIGAFLGWKATLFTVAAGSTFGAIFGVFTALIGQRKWAAIPFGPYLAAGALLWIAAGPALVQAWLNLGR